MTFSKKPLHAGATLGDRLRALRTEAGLSVEQIAKKTDISAKYITALEESRYNDVPGLVYARQFVRRYSEALETDVPMALSIFEQEYIVVKNTQPNNRPLLSQRVSTDFHWTRRHGRLIIASLIVALFLGYLAVQAAKNFLPPQLHISEPSQDVSTRSLTITVSGTTDQNATVTINDQDVQTSGDGAFTESIDLRLGLNTLKISAIKKHSSPRVITRQVLVE